MDVERGGSEVLPFQPGAVTLYGSLGEAGSARCLVPVEKSGEREVVAAARVGGGYGVEDQSLDRRQGIDRPGMKQSGKRGFVGLAISGRWRSVGQIGQA